MRLDLEDIIMNDIDRRPLFHVMIPTPQGISKCRLHDERAETHQEAIDVVHARLRARGIPFEQVGSRAQEINSLNPWSVGEWINGVFA